jgi:L-ascorbate metabolism protein UlaG (beta-lactamase superfamily)
MDIQYYGANCIVLSNKGTRIVIDDNLADLGGKAALKSGDVALYTGAHGLPGVEVKLAFDQPGEYEVSDISITGIPARGHMDEPSQHTSTMYKVFTGDLNVFVPGHIYPELTEEQLETIGIVDVMCVPVGGNGFTLDPVGALTLIKKVEPKLVVPTHYADASLNYTVPQQELDNALKELAMEPRERVAKLKVKPTELSDVTQLVVLERS